MSDLTPRAVSGTESPEQLPAHSLESVSAPVSESRGRWEEPIIDVDYIVDHYAILGVNHSASPDEIKCAYRAMMMEWHSDRFTNAPDTLKQQADRKVRLISEAYEVLADEDKRNEYTARLQSFNPKLVSKDGTPILSLSARRVQVERLMAGAELDLSEIRNYAEQLSGHNESIFEVIKLSFNTNNQNPAVRDAYRAALEKKLAFYSVLEELGWREAGVSNQIAPKYFADTDGYLSQRTAQIEETSSEIEGLVERKLLQLSRGETPMLLTSGSVQITAEDLKSGQQQRIREDLARIAKSHFEKHSETLLELAQKRMELIDELLTQFSEYRYLIDRGDSSQDLLVLLDRNGPLGVGLKFTCSENGAEMTMVNLPQLKSRSDFDDLVIHAELDAAFPDCGIAHLKLNQQFDMVVQACHVMQLHINHRSKPE